MASKTDKLNLVISLKEVKKTGTSIAGLGKKLISLKGIIAASFATAAIVKFTKASNIQEAAVTSLNAALKNTGIYSAALSNELQTLASDLQKVTTEGDEATLANQALMINLGKLSADVIPEATKAAIGLSRKMGVDARTAFMLLGRAAQGATQMFSRYGIQLDMNMTDQERFTEILKIGNEAFSLATDEAKSGAGQMKQFGNMVGDLQEAFGDLIKLALVPVIPHLMTLVEYAIEVVEVFTDVKKAIDEMTLSEITIELERLNRQISFLTTTAGKYKQAQESFNILLKRRNELLVAYWALKVPIDESEKKSIVVGETKAAQIEQLIISYDKMKASLSDVNIELSAGEKALQRMFDTWQEETDRTNQTWIDLAHTISGTWASVSLSAHAYFRSVAAAFAQMLNRMLAEMMAKAVIFGILNMITGGTAGGFIGGARAALGFQTGGYTGDIGGIVHKHEYVIPDWMVAGMPGTIAGLEAVRAGGGSNVTNNINLSQGAMSDRQWFRDSFVPMFKDAQRSGML